MSDYRDPGTKSTAQAMEECVGFDEGDGSWVCPVLVFAAYSTAHSCSCASVMPAYFYLNCSRLPIPSHVSKDGLRLRSMEPRDMGEVKRLHEQCFPVRYDRVSFGGLDFFKRRILCCLWSGGPRGITPALCEEECSDFLVNKTSRVSTGRCMKSTAWGCRCSRDGFAFQPCLGMLVGPGGDGLWCHQYS